MKLEDKQKQGRVDRSIDVGVSGTFNLEGTTATTFMIHHQISESILETLVFSDRIEIVVKITDNSPYLSLLSSYRIPKIEKRVYKAILEEGIPVLRVVEAIKGKFIPASEEGYEF